MQIIKVYVLNNKSIVKINLFIVSITIKFKLISTNIINTQNLPSQQNLFLSLFSCSINEISNKNNLFYSKFFF